MHAYFTSDSASRAANYTIQCMSVGVVVCVFGERGKPASVAACNRARHWLWSNTRTPPCIAYVEFLSSANREGMEPVLALTYLRYVRTFTRSFCSFVHSFVRSLAIPIFHSVPVLAVQDAYLCVYETHNKCAHSANACECFR